MLRILWIASETLSEGYEAFGSSETCRRSENAALELVLLAASVRTWRTMTFPGSNGLAASVLALALD